MTWAAKIDSTVKSILAAPDLDTGKTFYVYEKNMEFWRGRNNGWFVLAVSSDQQDDSDDCEAFSLEIACELIGDTPQANGIMVIRQG